MKKTFLIVAALVSFTTFAFAGGDQNQNRHDGAIGQGFIQQEREATPRNPFQSQISGYSHDRLGENCKSDCKRAVTQR